MTLMYICFVERRGWRDCRYSVPGSKIEILHSRLDME